MSNESPPAGSTEVATVGRAKMAAVGGPQFSRRALAAGGAGRRGAMATAAASESALQTPAPKFPPLVSTPKYLVIGDGLLGPFMALCLRVHGIACDLYHRPSEDDADRGTIVLTPSSTQLLGDALGVGVPSGSVVGRILSFDHIGNDMCDMDLNEFREKGESPTFFSCERLKIESALLSLCHIGPHSCTVLPPRFVPERGGLEALPNGGVSVKFDGGTTVAYKGIISTARDMSLTPELTLSNAELQNREENLFTHRTAVAQAPRWAEHVLPPLPDLKQGEKRFTPGSQEIVEILTPREAKMIVRPTMLATKLFYHTTMIIPDNAPDPRRKTASIKEFWETTMMHWTSGIPGYISHTMFRGMIEHLQQHFSRNSVLIFKTPTFVMPHWTEAEGRIIRIGSAAHGSCFDAVDVSDAQGFADAFLLARALQSPIVNVTEFAKERRLQVMEEMAYHQRLTNYSLKERTQMSYMASRFMMKMMRRYRNSWRQILKRHVTLVGR